MQDTEDQPTTTCHRLHFGLTTSRVPAPLPVRSVLWVRTACSRQGSFSRSGLCSAHMSARLVRTASEMPSLYRQPYRMLPPPMPSATPRTAPGPLSAARACPRTPAPPRRPWPPGPGAGAPAKPRRQSSRSAAGAPSAPRPTCSGRRSPTATPGITALSRTRC